MIQTMSSQTGSDLHSFWCLRTSTRCLCEHSFFLVNTLTISANDNCCLLPASSSKIMYWSADADADISCAEVNASRLKLLAHVKLRAASAAAGNTQSSATSWTETLELCHAQHSNEKRTVSGTNRQAPCNEKLACGAAESFWALPLAFLCFFFGLLLCQLCVSFVLPIIQTYLTAKGLRTIDFAKDRNVCTCLLYTSDAADE